MAMAIATRVVRAFPVQASAPKGPVISIGLAAPRAAPPWRLPPPIYSPYARRRRAHAMAAPALSGDAGRARRSRGMRRP